MTLLAILILLVVEYYTFGFTPPYGLLIRREDMTFSPQREWVRQLFERYANYLELHFNAGQTQHGLIAWFVAMIPVASLIILLCWIANTIHPLVSFLFNCYVLFLAITVKPTRDFTTCIYTSLAQDDLEEARRLLSTWQRKRIDLWDHVALCKYTIERLLLSLHLEFFGVLFWFLVGLPFGYSAAFILLYRFTLMLSQKWGGLQQVEDQYLQHADVLDATGNISLETKNHDPLAQFGRFAIHCAYWFDWIPARVTALSYAIMGNFIDALQCWRMQAKLWIPRNNAGVVLASGAGALTIRLGDSLTQLDGSVEYRAQLGHGRIPELLDIQKAQALITRIIIFWLSLMALATAAYWIKL